MTRLLLAVSLIAMSACAATNNDSDFLCGAQTGQPCQTMSEVDGRAAPSRASTSHQATPQRASTSRTASLGTQVRIPERTGRLWIAPHLDGAGIMHEGSYVQFVVRSARWASK